MESKYTKAERREIYSKAYNILSRISDDSVCCHVLALATGKGSEHLVSKNFITEHLPEFNMFQPEVEGISGRWFDDVCNTREGYGARLMCLLLCVEMCND